MCGKSHKSASLPVHQTGTRRHAAATSLARGEASRVGHEQQRAEWSEPMQAAVATTLDRPIPRNQVRFMPTEMDSGLIVPMSHQRNITEADDLPAFSTLVGDIYDASVD